MAHEDFADLEYLDPHVDIFSLFQVCVGAAAACVSQACSPHPQHEQSFPTAHTPCRSPAPVPAVPCALHRPAPCTVLRLEYQPAYYLQHYSRLYFSDQLGAASVEWSSKRMTL
jgi:hypothetical protein